jgi:hypothetical protein
VQHILSGGVDIDAWLDDAIDTRPKAKYDGIPSGT